VEVYEWPEFQIEKGGRFNPVLSEGVRIGKESTAGFPSLFSSKLPYSSELRMARVNKFGRPSSRASIILELHPPAAATAESMREFVGKTYFVEWPYLREAYIKSVSDGTCAITQLSEGIKTVTFAREEADKWSKEAALERDKWLTSSGLDIGPVQVIMTMIPISGMVTTAYGSVKKRFEGRESRCPLQLASDSPTENDPRFKERDALRPGDLFPLGSSVISMRIPLKGKLGTVVGHSGGGIDVEFSLTPKVPRVLGGGESLFVVVLYSRYTSWLTFQNVAQVRMEEEFFGTRLVDGARDGEVWVSSGQMASLLRVSPLVIGKLLLLSPHACILLLI
jgi:hypothetical protein